MKRTCLVFCVAVLLVFAPTYLAAQSGEEIYRECGVEHQFAQFMDAFVAQLQSPDVVAQMYGDVPPVAIELMLEAVPVALDPPAMGATVIDALWTELTAAERREVLRSGTGRRVTEVENAGSAPDAPLRMQEYVASGAFDRLTPARRELLDRLDAAAHITQGSIDMVMGTQLGLPAGAFAMMQIDPAELDGRLGGIMGRLEAARPQVHAAVAPQIPVSLAFTYGPVTDTQLRSYVEFLESPAGTHYSEVMTGAIVRACTDGAHRFGVALISAFSDL